jgi:DNA-nicking Smr family endonuclease
MRAPRALSPDERALWRRVAATVSPLAGRQMPAPADKARESAAVKKPAAAAGAPSVKAPKKVAVPTPAPATLDGPIGLDASWERTLGRGLAAPDFTLDLHGLGLEAAHVRLEHGLALALAQQARVVLVIAGRPRLAASADRAHQRGAIRAKLLDWLAHGAHAGRIAAVRPAHRRHGGAGAVYVVLRRPR